MECGCLTYDGFDDGETIEFPITKPVARKEYTCLGCRTKILRGDKYSKVKTMTDGYFSTYKYHVCCYSLLTGMAGHFMTGWWYSCSFMDCLDGWIEELGAYNGEDKHDRLIDLCGEVIEISNREGGTDGQH